MTPATPAISTSVSDLPSWNLTDLYPSPTSPECDKDIAWAEKEASNLRKELQGKLESLTGEQLANALKRYESLQEIVGKFTSYAYLLYAEDMTHGEHVRFFQNTMEKANQIGIDVLFFTLEINKIDENVLQEKMKTPALAHYAPWIRDVRVFRPYQLSDEIEALLQEKSLTGRQSWNRLFDETFASLQFPLDGKSLSSAEVLHLLSSPDRDVRKKAGKAFAEVLEKNASVFALITNVLAKDKEIEDRLRKFERPISSRNLANYIEDEVVDRLLASVKSYYPKLSHRYYALKAKWLGLPKLGYYDRNAPLPEDDDRVISWDEAVKLVLESYAAFSPKLASIGQQFFEKNWIDAPVRKGKESGAFAHPVVPSAHPYLLVNFQGKTRDVMTLAHELGHGIHQVLAGKQGALMSDTPLTLAETASVFGEQLTFRRMLAGEENPKRRRIMIAGKIEDMLNTVVRQVAFCEFERKVHEERRDGELSLDRLCEIWLSIQKESLGSAFDFDEEYRYYWMYISHFIHSPFYVYAYAFGDCLVNALYAEYMQHPQGFEDKYITMLAAGGTLRHKELLAPFGLDATAPTFWEQGLKVLEEFINMLEKETV